MPKTKLISTVAIIGLATTMTAQQKHPFPKRNETEKTGQHHWIFPQQQNALHKTTSGSRLKSYSTMMLDGISATSLTYSDSAFVNYTSGYGGGQTYNNDGSNFEEVFSNLMHDYYVNQTDGGAGAKYDLGIEYNWGIRYDNGVLYSYDTNAGAWDGGDVKVQATYNAGGNLLTYEYFAFDSSSSTWFSYMKYIFTYNTANKCNSIDQQFWDGTQLANLLRYEFTYNANNQTSEIVGKLWDDTNNNWSNSGRTSIVYSGGKISSITEDVWNNGAWDNWDGYSFHYGANGYIDYVENGYWQPSTSSYLYDYKNTFTYDAANRVTTQTLQYTSSTVGKCDYSYNADNYITQIADYKWDFNSYTPYGKFNYYYESYTTGVADVKDHGGSIFVYPSPASEVISIRLAWEESQAFSVSIADMQGRVWMSRSNKPCKEYSESMDIKGLPSGNYQVMVQGVKGSMVQKISVVH